MKMMLIVLATLLLFLQYRLWVGEGSLAHVSRLRQQIDAQQQENARLQAQNSKLVAEVEALREGYTAIEAKAREELGLIKDGETFFLFVEDSEEPDE